jgi:hypothetical protein
LIAIPCNVNMYKSITLTWIPCGFAEKDKRFTYVIREDVVILIEVCKLCEFHVTNRPVNYMLNALIFK